MKIQISLFEYDLFSGSEVIAKLFKIQTMKFRIL